MTHSRSFRGTAGGFLRCAAHVAAAALVVTAMFAALWAGPVAVASASRVQPRASASPSPAKVKYYVVPPSGSGTAPSLFAIAAKTLGDGNRYMEIFNLNKGRLQPDGGRLESPHVIEAAWVLQLPADATGPGVHLGMLPVLTASATAKVSHQPARPAAAEAAVPDSTFSKANLVGAVLIVFVAVVLIVALGRRRRRGRRARRRRAQYAEAPGFVNERPDYFIPTAANARGGDPNWRGYADPRRGADDGGHPSFPGYADPRRGADTGGHPSFPGYADPRRGADTGGHPSRPDPRQARTVGRSGPPQRESPATLHHDPRQQAASPSAPMPQGRVTPSNQGPSAMATTQAYYEVAMGEGPLQVVLSEPPAIGQEGMADLEDPIRREVEELWNADSLRLARRILSDADTQAAEIKHEARDQATSALAAAERQAADLRRQASDHAAATLAAAEWEAAELRTAIMKISTELSGVVTAYVTENLAISAKPATRPAARALPEVAESLTSPVQPATAPATRPATAPATRPARAPATTRPAAKPADRRTKKPADRRSKKPAGGAAAKPKGRQVNAMRKMVAALVIVFLVGGLTGVSEIGLHGFSFFLFRNTGAGAGNSRDLEENQGPGQADAPGTHHKANAAKPSSKPSGKPSSKPSSKPSKSN